MKAVPGRTTLEQGLLFHQSHLTTAGFVPRSHAPRGNACRDALRRGRARSRDYGRLCPVRDAERRGRHSHAERGNEGEEREEYIRSGHSQPGPSPCFGSVK
jgi:hypothetical protein